MGSCAMHWGVMGATHTHTLSALTKEHFAIWGSRRLWWARLLGRAGLCPSHRYSAQLILQAKGSPGLR